MSERAHVTVTEAELVLGALASWCEMEEGRAFAVTTTVRPCVTLFLPQAKIFAQAQGATVREALVNVGRFV